MRRINIYSEMTGRVEWCQVSNKYATKKRGGKKKKKTKKKKKFVDSSSSRIEKIMMHFIPGIETQCRPSPMPYFLPI